MYNPPAPIVCFCRRHGELPGHLRSSETDVGFRETAAYVNAQAEYTYDKVLRQHEGKEIAALDAGAGGGHMGTLSLRFCSVALLPQLTLAQLQQNYCPPNCKGLGREAGRYVPPAVWTQFSSANPMKPGLHARISHQQPRQAVCTQGCPLL